MIGLLQDGEILNVTQNNLQQPVALCVRQEGAAQTAVVEELTADEFERAARRLLSGQVVLINDVRGMVPR